MTDLNGVGYVFVSRWSGTFLQMIAGLIDMNRSLTLLGCLVLPAMVLAQDNTQRDMHQMHKLHQDPKAYIAMLDDPARDAYQKPHEVITARKLKENEVIADIGVGSGYFTFRLAHHVGEAGRVYAVDVSPASSDN